MKYLGTLSLLLLLLITSCREDIEDVITVIDTPGPTVIEGYEPTQKIINGSVVGFVVDENQEPMAYTKVFFEDITLTTDHFGHFFLDDINMNALGSLIKTESEGYFPGSRRFFPIEGTKNRVKIEMIKKNFTEGFLSIEGGTLPVENGGTLYFEPNSIRAENGELYDGFVKIAAKWMNPENLRTFDQMPGNLQGVGISTQNQEAALGTYGMMAVELQSDSGEKLNIAEGFTATLTMPVPENLLANAPSEIILWVYNEDYGVWHEQSTATLQNGAYVGEVSHFSFWNCDVPFNTVHLTVNIRDEDNVGISNYSVIITAEGIGTAGGYTDHNGQVAGLVPANKELTATIYDQCGNTLEVAPLGIFTTDAETFISPIPTTNTIITGELVCNEMPAEGGLILVEFEETIQYYYIDNFDFEINIRACSSTSEIKITAINLRTLEQNESSTIPIEENIDLGTLDICNLTLGVEQYIIMTVNEESIIYIEPYMSAGDSSGITITQIFAQSFDNQNLSTVRFYYEGAFTTGSFEDTAIFKWYRNDTYNWEFTSSPSSTPNLSSFVITEYGEPGAYVTGNFETTLLNTGVDPAEEVTLVCNFRVKRIE